MPLFETGGPQFGLSDVKIATWNSDGSYGSAVDIPSVQMFSVNARVVSAELTGDDRITATASRVVGASLQMRNGSVTIAALEILFGLTATSSIASPNNVKNLRINSGIRLPYFGVIGKVLAEEGDGDLWAFIPKCRITADVTLMNAGYGTFVVPEMNAVGVADEDYGVINFVVHETEAAVTIPPVNIPVNA